MDGQWAVRYVGEGARDELGLSRWQCFGRLLRGSISTRRLWRVVAVAWGWPRPARPPAQLSFELLWDTSQWQWPISTPTPIVPRPPPVFTLHTRAFHLPLRERSVYGAPPILVPVGPSESQSLIGRRGKNVYGVRRPATRLILSNVGGGWPPVAHAKSSASIQEPPDLVHAIVVSSQVDACEPD
jgi:hypothetical protein